MTVVEERAPAPAAALAGSAEIGDVLHRIALTVNSTLDVKEVLERLARAALDVVAAERCTLFLVESVQRRLVPALSLARVPDAHLWGRFREMAPIDIDAEPERREFMRAGRAIAVPDLADSPIAPPGVAHAFGARSALLAPLKVAGDLVGLLVLDWPEPNRPADATELRGIEAIAAYAALAVRNARLYAGLAEETRGLQQLVDVAAALNSSLELPEMLDLVCRVFGDLLESDDCAVYLVEGDSPEVAAIRGNGVRIDITAVLEALGRDPSRRPLLRVDLADGVPTSVAAFPLVQGSAIVGLVTVRVGGGGHLSDVVGRAQALADMAAAAVKRARLDEALRSRLIEVESLYRLSQVVGRTSSLPAALRELSGVLGSGGTHLEAVALQDERLANALGARLPDAAELEAIKAWRRTRRAGATPEIVEGDGHLLVPVWQARRVLGALRVRTDEGPLARTTVALVRAIASGCADVARRMELQLTVAERERSLTIAAERDRIARDLHDTVGQAVTAIGLRLADYVVDAPDRAWRTRLNELLQLAGRCNRDVRQSIAALVLLDAKRDGLEPSLQKLLQQFEATTGVRTRLTVTGPPGTLEPTVEDALFRVAHEALLNVERHARASCLDARLIYRDAEVTLEIRDDGVGLMHRDPFAAEGGHFGLRGIQRRMHEVGGSLRVRNAPPRGVLVEATVELDAAATGRSGGAARASRSR